MGQRVAVLFCAFGSTSLQISGLAWDLGQLEVKTVVVLPDIYVQKSLCPSPIPQKRFRNHGASFCILNLSVSKASSVLV